MKRTILSLTALVAACSGPQTNSLAPTALSSTAAVSPTERSSAQFYTGRNSCPVDEQMFAPKVNPTAGGSVVVTWVPNQSVTVYQLELQRYDVTNVFQTIWGTVVQDTVAGNGTIRYDIGGPQRNGGRFRVRVRYRNTCGAFGPWALSETFGLDGTQPDAVAPTPVVEEDEAPVAWCETHQRWDRDEQRR